MEEIKINEYFEADHSRAINEDNYNVSRTCEYEKNEMHHIHNSCEILFIEEGTASYYISGKKYDLEPNDILIIGAMEHHQRRITCLPFLRHGVTIRPSYYKSLMLEDDLLRVFTTPTVDHFWGYYKNIDPETFHTLIYMLQCLKAEEMVHKPFRSQMERTIITQLAVTLFRVLGFKRNDSPLSAANIRMLEIKEYIDTHYCERLDLKVLGDKFYMHPTTISKDFNKYCGCTLNKYINTVRICEAAKLLESNNDSIKQIAEQCGYDSENTFLRQFKLIMEVSPLQYRKAQREWLRQRSIRV